MKTTMKEYLNNGFTIVLDTEVTYSVEKSECGRIGNSSLTYRINGAIEIEKVEVVAIELYRNQGTESDYFKRSNLSEDKRKWADRIAQDKVIEDLENNNLDIELWGGMV